MNIKKISENEALKLGLETAKKEDERYKRLGSDREPHKLLWLSYDKTFFKIEEGKIVGKYEW
jgi:hypothetical protein